MKIILLNMPINYKEYHPDWRAISLRIRKERAQDKCEWCGAKNAEPHPITGSKVCLTVAHIDRDKRNNDDANLAALCQKCHLHHDRHQHTENRRNGRNWKRDQTKLDL